MEIDILPSFKQTYTSPTANGWEYLNIQNAHTHTHPAEGKHKENVGSYSPDYIDADYLFITRQPERAEKANNEYLLCGNDILCIILLRGRHTNHFTIFFFISFPFIVTSLGCVHAKNSIFDRRKSSFVSEQSLVVIFVCDGC